MPYRIRPTPGKVVRDPDHDGHILPVEGIVVDKLSTHWRRREREHGVVVTDQPASTTVDPAIAGAIAIAPFNLAPPEV